MSFPLLRMSAIRREAARRSGCGAGQCGAARPCVIGDPVAGLLFSARPAALRHHGAIPSGPGSVAAQCAGPAGPAGRGFAGPARPASRYAHSLCAQSRSVCAEGRAGRHCAYGGLRRPVAVSAGPMTLMNVSPAPPSCSDLVRAPPIVRLLIPGRPVGRPAALPA